MEADEALANAVPMDQPLIFSVREVMSKAESMANTEKLVISGVGVAESEGLRDTQEDTHVVVEKFLLEVDDGVKRSLFSVHDGHGGALASEYVRDNLAGVLAKDLSMGGGAEESLRQTYLQLDGQIEKTDFPYGCTAATVLLEGVELITANVGDTRVLLVNQETGSVERLSRDHTLMDEEEEKRVLATGARTGGGRIFKGGAGINVVRALGDKLFGDSVSPEPTVSRRKLLPGKYRLVLECDGVWHAVKDEDVPALIAGKDAREASQAMIDNAFEKRSCDNYTAVVVEFEIT